MNIFTRWYSKPEARRIDGMRSSTALSTCAPSSRERRTHAEVDPPPEPELTLHDVAAVEVELLRALEHRFVVVRRRVAERDGRTCGNGDAGELLVLGGPAEQHVHDRAVTQAFFDRDGYE